MGVLNTYCLQILFIVYGVVIIGHVVLNSSSMNDLATAKLLDSTLTISSDSATPTSDINDRFSSKVAAEFKKGLANPNFRCSLFTPAEQIDKQFAKVNEQTQFP